MNFDKNSKGSFSIFAAFSFVACIMFLFFVIDIGIKFYNESKLEDVADIAAQAGVRHLDGSQEGYNKAIDEVKKIFIANEFEEKNIESIQIGTTNTNSVFTITSIKNANALKVTAKKTSSSILLSLMGNGNYDSIGKGSAQFQIARNYPVSCQSDNISLDVSLVKDGNRLRCDNKFIIDLSPQQSCHSNEFSTLFFKKITNLPSGKTITTEINQIVGLEDFDAENLRTVLTSKNSKVDGDGYFYKTIPLYNQVYDYYSYKFRPTIVGYGRIKFKYLSKNEYSAEVSCGSSSMEENFLKTSNDYKNNFGFFDEKKLTRFIKSE